MDPISRQAVEAVARDSCAQLLAFVAARAGGDVASAEDALSDAFLAALKQWPIEGVPRKPEAWLLTAARRRLADAQRRGETRLQAMNALIHAMEAAQEVVDAGHGFPDDRLKLLFVCAHPAIDAAARTPLMLQVVLGLEAERIASAFLTSPIAMSQRLVRAKSKIRDAGIPFVVPPKDEWAERLGFVLEAIYAAYTTGWDSPEGQLDGLVDEAIWLARVLRHLLPEEPEVLGLLALLLHSHARRSARVRNGRYVPLPEQDTTLWDQDLIKEAEIALRLAARSQALGRFQLEAAIQSIHAQRAHTGTIYWHGIARMYEVLASHTPALGASIGQAIAVAQVHGPDVGLALLDAMPCSLLTDHQPYWATRAQLLADANRLPEARMAYKQAIGLSDNAMVREFLQERLLRVEA
jgi:RNA polymerase sigma-70 factor (ECF subfamily)